MFFFCFVTREMGVTERKTEGKREGKKTLFFFSHVYLNLAGYCVAAVVAVFSFLFRPRFRLSLSIFLTLCRRFSVSLMFLLFFFLSLPFVLPSLLMSRFPPPPFISFILLTFLFFTFILLFSCVFFIFYLRLQFFLPISFLFSNFSLPLFFLFCVFYLCFVCCLSLL